MGHIEELYTFDDVLIRPGRSEVEPREAEMKTAIARGFFVSIPFLSAAMDTVTDDRMAAALGALGGLGVIHRNQTIAQQCEMVRKAKKTGVLVGAACGPFDKDRALALQKAGADVVSIDCAHGHNANVLRSVREIKKSLKRAKLFMGNIATAQAARDICGFVDAIKVGVGPGSICTTRIISGVGVPQLSAIMEVSAVAKRFKVPVIADGGMRTSGDIAKALAAGASAVMLGNMFAGTLEAPGKIVTRNGKKFKYYRGMGSKAVIETQSAETRYLTKGRKAVPEGVEALVPYKGELKEVVAELISGIQVAMGYVGARTIVDLHSKAQFIRITRAGVIEGSPHSLSEILG
ncbi:IMP dehydrogenase [Acetobacteraceae bacterium]|nr:IMP dehydrogenase [Candidatus Parcubacteria bacterium]